MEWLKRWWVVLVVAVAIVVGIATGFTVQDEKNKIAAYAAVVGTVSILLAAEKHWRDKKKEDKEQQQKEEDKRELLRATLEFRAYEISVKVLGVELYNAGKTTVPIKSVQLVVNTGETLATHEMVCSDPNHKHRVRLEPKDHVRFHVSMHGKQIKVNMLEIKPEFVYIAVNSFSGEVVRVPGEEIQAFLKTLTTTETQQTRPRGI